MIFDVLQSSLKAPQRIIPVEELFGQARGSRMPEVKPERLSREIAEIAGSVCPTSALSVIEAEGKRLLRFDYGECIGCGRCEGVAPEAFPPAARLLVCGVSRQQ